MVAGTAFRPIAPFANTVINVVVEFPAVVEAMVKSGVLMGVLAEFEIDNMEYGVVVPIPTLTASAPVPPKAMQLEQPTRAFSPMATDLVRGVVEGTDESREAWYPRKVMRESVTERRS